MHVCIQNCQFLEAKYSALTSLGRLIVADKEITFMTKKVNNRVGKADDDGCISDSTLEYLLVNSTGKAGQFYLLLKIHKGFSRETSYLGLKYTDREDFRIC